MYDLATRQRTLALLDEGHSLNSVSVRTGISRSAIRSWQRRLLPLRPRHAGCPRCSLPRQPPEPAAAYAYLLGLYLGDGCISPLRRTHFLRIACSDAWPGLVDECALAMSSLRPGNAVFRVQKQGCVMVTAYSKHWLCLFPQHGAGKKHERRIELAVWQREIVTRHPWELIRGLVHSDGCRVVNRAVRKTRCGPKRYEYPRYFFTNKSVDIVALYCATLDAVGVEWRSVRRTNGAQNVSVARRSSVALMEAHVGAKY